VGAAVHVATAPCEVFAVCRVGGLLAGFGGFVGVGGCGEGVGLWVLGGGLVEGLGWGDAWWWVDG
jgi:hypothetical protein